MTPARKRPTAQDIFWAASYWVLTLALLCWSVKLFIWAVLQIYQVFETIRHSDPATLKFLGSLVMVTAVSAAAGCHRFFSKAGKDPHD